MAGLDLTGVEKFVDDSILVDTVVVGRWDHGAGGVLDDDVNDQGQVVPLPSVWVGQETRAAVLGLPTSGAVTTPEIQRLPEAADARARLFVPLDSAVPIRSGDHVWAITANAPVHDPSLLEYEWEVVSDATPSSFNVIRMFLLKVAGRPMGQPAPPPGP